MPAPSALVAEDESVLRDELCAHLSALWPELRIVARAANGLEALQLQERHRPDVLFLDIEMPGLSGLEVARQAERRQHLVFITAYDAHAVAAFERGAVDYVLKPYTAARLAESVRRVKERLGRAVPAPEALDSVLRELAAVAQPREHLRWINASSGTEVRVITVDEVCYFRADTKYTLVATAEGEALIRRTLKELLDQLDPAQFWQVHRSTVINLRHVAGTRRDELSRLFVRLRGHPVELPVSRAYVHLFKAM